MRKGLNGLRWAAVAAIGPMISSPAGAAAGEQTAEGAQQFLVTTMKKVPTHVGFVDAAGRTNYVTGKLTGQVKTIKGGAFGKPKETVQALPEQFVDKQLGEVRPAVLEAIDAHGRPNACATRLTEVVSPPYDDAKSDVGNDSRSFSWTMTYTDQAWKYEPLSKFMTPAQVIDWSNAKVSRNPQGVWVTSKGQNFPTIYLSYSAADHDLADRIEFAMKFLIMSCDESAATGF